MSEYLTCEECGQKMDLKVNSNTQCSKCKKYFCCALHKTCFSDYHRKKVSCDGCALTITNPKWIINLRNSNDK
jgi:hypothetical protein